MSLESWKAEFYPVSADKATGSEEGALEHSLRKWRGLLPSELAKHGCSVDGDTVRDEVSTGFTLELNYRTCALCRRHSDFHRSVNCGSCSLCLSAGAACDEEENDEHGHAPAVRAPYYAMTEGGDPKPMIAALERAVIWLKQQKEPTHG